MARLDFFMVDLSDHDLYFRVGSVAMAFALQPARRVLTAFADDMAMALHAMQTQLPRLLGVLLLVGRAALIDLNVINCDCEKAQSSMNIMICQVLSNQPSPKIKRFCKVEITDVNRLEAVYYADYEWRKAEAIRKEEEARKKAEEAAAAEGDG